MPFIPHTEADTRAMLAAIGADSIDALFDEIPPSLRAGALAGVPPRLNEMQVMQLMQARAREDGRPS
jgi:glycine dehydrogenase subunit 1